MGAGEPLVADPSPRDAAGPPPEPGTGDPRPGRAGPVPPFGALGRGWRRLDADPRAAWAVAAVAVALALSRYFQRYGMFRDEAALAVSLIRRSFSELRGPLAYGQEAPLGFLAIQHVLVRVLGDSELTFRLLPLLLGLATLPLFAAAGRRIVGGALLPLLFFVTATSFYVYATTAKQYAADPFFATLVIWQADRLLASPRRAEIAAFAATGAAAVWLSHPSVFVLAAAGAALSLASLRSGRYRDLLWQAALYLAWLASFAVVFALAYARTSQSDIMQTDWAGNFMPLDAHLVGWLVRHVPAPFRIRQDYPLLLTPGAALLVAVGVWWVARKNLPRAVLLAGPLPLVLLAAAARLYPFADRLLLFLAPGLTLLTVAGIRALVEAPARGRPWARALPAAGVALAVCLLAGRTVQLARGLYFAYEDSRPAFAELERELAPGDGLYVYAGAWKAYDYYRPHFTFPARARVVIGSRAERPEAYDAELARLEGSPRVWVLMIQVPGSDAHRPFLARLHRWCPAARAHVRADVAVYRCTRR